MKKGLVFCLIALWIVSNITLLSSSLASVTKPSVPEFNVSWRLVSQAENDSVIEFTFKNQPFDRGLNYSFYYNIRYRVNGGDWREVYRPDDGFPSQSSSEYTVLSFSWSNEYDGRFLDTSTNPPWSFAIIAPFNAVLDVQAEAMIGWVHRVANPNSTDQLTMYPYVFSGETSGWSSIQTITLGEGASPTTPTSDESVGSWTESLDPWQLITVGLAVVVVLVVSISLVYFRKNRDIKR